jgi:glycosyltransferase involved in cell wall biosynthesis
LAFLPVNKLIVHERGTIWNQKSSNWLIPRFVAWKASVVISNSIATKTMLKKKFNIDSKKIRVLHNGINISNSCIYNDIRKKKSVFRIGFIGRLDSPKGVHVLIDAMRLLMHKNINLVIAGEGALEGVLKKKSSKLSNVKFVGRVGNPYLFISTIDLLIVPSIREPLGNVCIEAGLCKTPVLAANIDGIPEIIENRVSGELINATDKISISLSGGGIPLPEFVVDPDTQNLVSAKQINPPLLAKKILELSNNPKQMAVYAENLHNKVVEYFNIQRYTEELHAIYNECFSMYR